MSEKSTDSKLHVVKRVRGEHGEAIGDEGPSSRWATATRVVGVTKTKDEVTGKVEEKEVEVEEAVFLGDKMDVLGHK